LKKIITYSLFLFIVTIVTSQVSFAQSDSLEIHQIKGKQYYIHIVEKGESLYFIHKKYDVPLKIIKKENPSVLDGLSIGEKIFIPVKKDIVVEVKTNGNFINHEIKKGQTLYSISKLYRVKQKEIIAANSEVTQGLSEGQIIRIPVSNIKNNNLPKSIINKPSYKTHLVKKGETLYSLSKLYQTTIDSIKFVNKGLKKGLKLGETIYIPRIQNTPNNSVSPEILSIVEKIENLNSDTIIIKKSEYSIGLLLPFYLDENDEITQHRNTLEEKTIYPKSRFAIEFYNGFIMALDSISTDSCKFKIYVYDTRGNDSLRINNIILKPEFNNLDIIVGPLYYDNFKYVVDFAQQNKIPLISPVKQSNKTLLGNDLVFKVIPSKQTTIKQICTLLVDSFKTENLLVIEYDKAKEKSLVDMYIKTYNNLILSEEDTTIYSSIKKLQINSNISDVVNNLRSDKNNVIFIPATEQTFITNLFNYLTTTLNKRNYKDYQVTLIGFEEWIKYENIDLDYFQKLNVHYCSSRFIDYKDSLTSLFIENYVNKKDIYPSINTLLGFDLAYYFGGILMNTGKLSPQGPFMNYKGLSIQLDFFKTGIESGFENTKSHMLRFNDFTIERIDH
jgi:LysM repeat protein